MEPLSLDDLDADTTIGVRFVQAGLTVDTSSLTPTRLELDLCEIKFDWGSIKFDLGSIGARLSSILCVSCLV